MTEEVRAQSQNLHLQIQTRALLQLDLLRYVVLQLSNFLVVLPDLLLVVLDVTLQALDRDLAPALVRVQIPLPLLQFLKLLSNSTRRADGLMSLDYVESPPRSLPSAGINEREKGGKRFVFLRTRVVTRYGKFPLIAPFIKYYVGKFT